MIIRIGLENGIEGRSLAWALDFPGCFTYGKDANTALMRIPSTLLQYERWIAQHTAKPWLVLGNFDIRLVDVWEVYKMNAQFEEAEDGKEINAWFLDDWRPLTGLEIERGLSMLAWSRADLLSILSGRDEASLDAPHPGDEWTLRKILEHLAATEAWCLDRLDLLPGPPDRTPHLFAGLEALRESFARQLPGLAGSKQVSGKDGEFWSPRKLLRRAIWHERDHTDHILKLLGLNVEHPPIA